MRLLLHQYRYDQKQFWREPASVFFTVVLPLSFFHAVRGDLRQRGDGRERKRDRHLDLLRAGDPRAVADQRDVS